MSKAKHIIQLIDEIVQDRDKLKETLPHLSDMGTPSGMSVKGVLTKLSRDRKFLDQLKDEPEKAPKLLSKKFHEISKTKDPCLPCLMKFLKALDIDAKESDFE